MAFLLATGERGLFAPDRPERAIAVARLDDATAAQLGWSGAGLDAVFAYAATLSADSLAIATGSIATGGGIVASFGDLSARYRVHSIRKALLSALVGRHLGEATGQIPLGATLQDLGIDDSPLPLTALQKQATVRDLLKSLSGINRPAAAEAGLTAEKDRRLGKGENEPGRIWAYNNWDYNALTTVFEQRTGLTAASTSTAERQGAQRSCPPPGST